MQMRNAFIIMTVLTVLSLLAYGVRDIEYFLKLKQVTVTDTVKHVDKAVLWQHEYYFSKGDDFKIRVTQNEYDSKIDNMVFKYAMGESLGYRIHSMIPRYIFQILLFIMFFLLTKSTNNESDKFDDVDTKLEVKVGSD